MCMTDRLFRILACSSFYGLVDQGTDYQASTDQVGMCIARVELHNSIQQALMHMMLA